MKIQENHFYKLDNSKEVKVIWKKYDKANILEVGIEYPREIVDLDRLSGIKITKENLLNFGFFITELDGFLKATLPNSRFTINQIKEYDGYLLCADENVITNIDYVHELQDLFYAFLKEELVFSGSFYSNIKKNNKMVWKKLSDETPTATKSGNWDGLKSDTLLLATQDKKKHVGVMYEGYIDGNYFRDFYDDDSCYEIKNVIYWSYIPPLF